MTLFDIPVIENILTRLRTQKLIRKISQENVEYKVDAISSGGHTIQTSHSTIFLRASSVHKDDDILKRY